MKLFLNIIGCYGDRVKYRNYSSLFLLELEFVSVLFLIHMDFWYKYCWFLWNQNQLGFSSWVRHWFCKFFLFVLDVTEPLLVEVDQIYHLACPASPIFYKHNPVKVCYISAAWEVVYFHSFSWYWCLWLSVTDHQDKCYWYPEHARTCKESWS